MRGEFSVPTAETAQFAREQREMHRFVRRDRQKIADELLAHLAAEAPRHVEREIDRDEFDVRERVP